MAAERIDYSKPQNMLKDPYFFEFLGIPKDKPILESDLEKVLNCYAAEVNDEDDNPPIGIVLCFGCTC